MALTLESRLALNTGQTMPVLGLGLWQVRGPDVGPTVQRALELGYRLFDTAKLYGNEREVGEAVRASGLPREELFVTTKLWNDDHGRERAPAAFAESLSRLGLDYVDLYLIHWPASDRRVETWRALTELEDAGRCRSFGVSNFTVSHLEELVDATGIVPAVDQVEQHPFRYEAELDRFCARHGIVVECYSPLARARRLDDPTLAEVARAHGRTVPQVMLRWGLEHGFVVIPKSVHPARLRENASVFDFSLEREERRRLDALSQGSGPD